MSKTSATCRGDATPGATVRVSVVLSTYQSPEWLERTVHGYAYQTHEDFELVIADDGSSDETRDLIDRLRDQTRLAIEHVWHDDQGFQKSKILNRALSRARSDYLVFSDGDCVPRADFLAVHVQNARPGYFLSGGYFKLTMAVSETVTLEAIAAGLVFDPKWLRASGQPWSLGLVRLQARPPWSALWDAITPTRASWNGHNASGWKRDLIAVNGFDERMEYGGQDRELGERLINSGVRSKQIRHRAICVHLDHARSYDVVTSRSRNLRIRGETQQSAATWTEHGIRKGPR